MSATKESKGTTAVADPVLNVAAQIVLSASNDFLAKLMHVHNLEVALKSMEEELGTNDPKVGYPSAELAASIASSMAADVVCFCAAGLSIPADVQAVPRGWPAREGPQRPPEGLRGVRSSRGCGRGSTVAVVPESRVRQGSRERQTWSTVRAS